MRYLNKIIFINSAHVPYAEIALDGNVHFIGTQGVGKSTLLRAILFFYNGDKTKLGIRTQDKQKNYDDFYLPYPNSYIVYEVNRENGKFCIISFISQGRTAFRIVDCAYDKRYFIEPDGMARSEWGRISEAIGHKIYKSNIIHNYEDFRDIIYGNKQNIPSRELHRFCLLESAKYQNVPRTIQNIFLNQSLESRVIKDTIIDSMDFSNDGIDLRRYREHLKSFQQQYEDIWKWYKKEKNGVVKVKAEADEVISKYSLYEGLKREIAELCAMVNYAYERDKELLPKIAEETDRNAQELSRQKRLLAEEQGKHNAESAKLNQEVGAVKSFLKTVDKKREYYASIKIEEIAKRISKEGELNIRKSAIEKEEELLTAQNNNVKGKYDSLIKNVDNGLQQYALQARERQNAIDSQLNAAMAKLGNERSAKRDEIDKQYQAVVNENLERIDIAKGERNQLLLDENSVVTTNPYKINMDELSARIKALQEEKASKASAEAQLSQRIQRIEHEMEIRRIDLENECKRHIATIETDIRDTDIEIGKLEQLLSKQKGSLIDWLNGNVKDWESSLGKVLDEENVLYNTHLAPAKIDSSNTIYGVKINLDGIDRTVRTPKMIEAERKALENKKFDLQQSILARTQQLQEDCKEAAKKPTAELKRLRAEKLQLSARLSIIPNEIDKCHKTLTEWTERLDAWRKSKLQQLAEKRGKIEKEIEDLERIKIDITRRHSAEIDKLRKAYDKLEKDAKSDAEAKKKNIESEMMQHKSDAERQKRELLAQMDAELKGLGVDVNKLEGLRRQRSDIEAELNYINLHRNEFIGWQNDTSEYFANEQARKDELRQLQQKLADLQAKFLAREDKLKAEIAQLTDHISELKKQIEKLNRAINKVDGLKHAVSCPKELLDNEQKETSQSLEELFAQLDADIRDEMRRREEFRTAVNNFKSNFSSQNTFNFRTELNGIEDYLEFATDLHEFMSNNKIEEYRSRTSERYASIISQIAKEVGEINRHGADIKATINEINHDFRENNFAGVIKDIELRSVESNDRMMQQLLNIKKFDDENSLNMGEMNLFSDEDSRKDTNQRAVSLLMTFIEMMAAESKRERITLSDTFKLEFRVKENDQDTGWVEKLSNVGSDGTDILVKAMVNIMLINVFKRKISRKFDNFQLHCMMDEIGKLHPDNVKGILKFANDRKIMLINSSPTTYNALAYKYTYSLSKDEKSNTIVKTLLTVR